VMLTGDDSKTVWVQRFISLNLHMHDYQRLARISRPIGHREVWTASSTHPDLFAHLKEWNGVDEEVL
jgi:hypothetical protein